jgi:hypothetical protein
MTETKKTKRAMAQDRRTRAAERQGLEPRSSLIERDEHGKAVACTPAGLRQLERLAREGAPQSKLAAALGMPQRRLKTLFDRNDGDNPVRLAYERGYADFEHAVVQRLLVHGKTNPIPLIFLAKAKLGWREGEQPAASVQSNVVISLPAPLTEAEYFKLLGIEKPLDFTKPLLKQRDDSPALPAPTPSPRDLAPWPILLGSNKTDDDSRSQLEPMR